MKIATTLHELTVETDRVRVKSNGLVVNTALVDSPPGADFVPHHRQFIPERST